MKQWMRDIGFMYSGAAIAYAFSEDMISVLWHAGTAIVCFGVYLAMEIKAISSEK